MKKGCCGVLVIMLLMTMVMTGCSGNRGKITITAQNTSEGYILTSMVRDLLEQAGYQVNELPGMTGADARKALLNGTIDAYVDYTGKVWNRDLQGKQHVQDPQKMLKLVQQADHAHGILWIDGIMKVDATPAVVIPEKCIHTLGTSISALAGAQQKSSEQAVMEASIPSESSGTSDSLSSLETWYQFIIPADNIQPYLHAGDAAEQLYLEGLSITSADQLYGIAIVSSTEPRLRRFGLAALRDDKKFYCAYTPALCIRQRFLKQHPEIAHILQPLAQTLTQQDMIQLNSQVEIDGMPPREIAMRYLKARKLAS